MAKLTVRALALEVTFDSIEYGWINYAIYFKWNGIPIINQSILWAGPRHINKADALWANDDEETLMSTMKKVLESYEPAYWETTEPDMIMAFFPGHPFPFMKSNWQVPTDMSSQAFSQAVLTGNFKAAEHPMEQVEHTMDKNHIQIIAKISTANFTAASEDDVGYGDEGISLHMVVEDWQLHNFLKELKTEYQALKERYPDEFEEDQDNKDNIV